jgi:hypothetical protein
MTRTGGIGSVVVSSKVVYEDREHCNQTIIKTHGGEMVINFFPDGRAKIVCDGIVKILGFQTEQMDLNAQDLINIKIVGMSKITDIANAKKI